MKESQEEVRKLVTMATEEKQRFFMLENKRFEISCCLFPMYLVKKDLTDKQDCGNEKPDTY